MGNFPGNDLLSGEERYTPPGRAVPHPSGWNVERFLTAPL